MPPLVAHHLLNPLLERNKMHPHAIDEWSIHQGGTSVLNRFRDKDLLGLTEEQLWPSQYIFQEYGNMSTPSCFNVLHHIMHKQVPIKAAYGNGCIVGFGAGYYLGALLYERIK